MAIRSLRVSQQLIRDYGRLNGDSLPIHYDPAAARARGFRAPVAHGTMLVAAIADAAVELHGSTFLLGGSVRARFVAPVCADDAVSIAICGEGDVTLRVEQLPEGAQVAVKGTVGTEQT